MKIIQLIVNVKHFLSLSLNKTQYIVRKKMKKQDDNAFKSPK